MRPRSKTELAGLVALSYGPFLASSPGQVSADSKQDLYLDPGRFLRRAVELWDPHVGAGTVPHQNLGYLLPTGPWFWALDRLGVPDWIAQRLWLGTISLLAVLGARWLFRQLGLGGAGALVGALVYLLTPYQLAFTARISVLLLPWAALPWLVGLTMRSTRAGGWRAPALLSVVLVGAGGINASSLLLLALGPMLWVVLELAKGTVQPRRAVAAAGRIGLLGTGVSLWWLVGLRLQGAHGLPVLQLTENVRTVAEFSTPSDILRGIGNWFFYGRDRTGYSIDQAADFSGGSSVVVGLSYAIPAVALGAAFLLRWAHRSFFALLVVVGTVVGVGAWPYDEPRPYGALWRAFTSHTSVGLAFRNSPRVVPLVVLGMAGLVAAAVAAVPVDQWRRVAGGSVAALAFGAMLPVLQHGYLTDGMQRPESVPRYWIDAARALDHDGGATRVLEIPGVSFAAYRWGTTVDPITPGLIDRPYLAREVLAQGTVGTANLLDALDRRMQQGIFEPRMLAPIARFFGVGTVVLRADLEQAGRFDTAAPGPLWQALLHAPGLSAPTGFGPPGGDGSDLTLPAVALFEVDQARPIVRTAPVQGPVILAGDGDGIVDAAAAGIIDGSAVVLESAALDDAALSAALAADAHVVVTDSNRRRIQTWFYSLRDTRGPTERTGETAPDPTGYDFRLDPFPGSSDDARTVVEQVGGRVDATSGGGPENPEDRGAHAVDGDPATAWRVGGRDPRGQSIVIVPARAVPTHELRLVQPPVTPGGRSIARVRIEMPGVAPMEVDLGPASHTPAGQVVALGVERVERVRIEIVETSPPSPTAGETPVGLAEIGIGSLRIAEVVRPPIDLMRRAGDRLSGHSLDIVLTRLRTGDAATGRADDEELLDRWIDLPMQRGFALTGTARPIPGGEVSPVAGELAITCREGLVALDGHPVAVRLDPAGDHATLTACSPIMLAAGRHRLTSTLGRESGINVDRVVLASRDDGLPARVAPRGTGAAYVGAKVTIAAERASHLELTVHTDGSPFWLVLGQSASDGWDATVRGGGVGPRQVVDGYANGWQVRPAGAGALRITLDWGPQRLVWWGIGASAVALAGIGVILLRTRRRSPPLVPALDDCPRWSDRRPATTVPRWRVVPAAVLVALVAMIVAPPLVAVLAGVVLALAWLTPRGAWLAAAVAPAALLLSRADHRPALAWVAVILLAGDVLRVEAATVGARVLARRRRDQAAATST